jgi:hypothetical protein
VEVVVADISIVNTGENSPEQVAYQLMKDIQASGVVFKLNADQFLDLYAECLTKGGEDSRRQARNS